MIVKRNFNPLKVLYYVRTELSLSVVLTLTVYFLHARGTTQISLPFSVAAILGSALAIFIAFRNNTAYSRWWEARTVWANILNSSRVFARQIIANADNAIATGKATAEKAAAFKQETIYRQIAFAHTLRLQLRGQHEWVEFKHLLADDEFTRLLSVNNLPNLLLLTQGIRVKEAIREELLGAFDSDMPSPSIITTNRLEAFSDGVIAIIITIMVFDLKFQNAPTASTVWMELRLLLPKFLGTSSALPHASAAYGAVFFLTSLSFTLLRNYAAGKAGLLHESISKQRMQRAKRKNLFGMGLYFLATIVAFFSVYVSFACFLIVPAMYFIPENIVHEVHENKN